MKNKKSLIIGIILVVIILAAIWWLASPLFLNKTVNEDFPKQNQENQPVGKTGQDNSNLILQGQFQDADSFHKTSGEALIIQESGVNYLRLEDFQATNGPDLYVYLSNDLDAENFVSLGELKGNQGNQNYEIPEDINPEDYQYVIIWCRAFSVLFGSAELQ